MIANNFKLGIKSIISQLFEKRKPEIRFHATIGVFRRRARYKNE